PEGLAACSKNDDIPGKLVVKITDCPFPIKYVESATVTITKIEIRQAGNYHKRHRYTVPPEDTIANEKCPYIVLSEDTITFDLLNLRNGITQELLNLEIPQGTYDLIRLYVSDAGLKIKDHHSPFNTKVPSGSQTGIKIFIRPPLVVEGGLTTELLLDFNLSMSFVMLGNMYHPMGITGFIFKPVIRAINNSTAGRVEGIVTDISHTRLADAQVWLEQDTVVATAFSGENGFYAMIGIPAGTYSVYATKENYDTVCVEDIKVTAANRTVVNFALTPQ
ncbi:MAG: DUF4382 domain-containing protein, partial [Bacteroidales bacterium]